MMNEQVSSYKTVINDTWDLISYKVYGSCDYVEELKKENYELKKLVFFPVDVLIKIPTISISEKGDLPKWFQE
ncbi:MAG: tail protein X [Cetobacterium sp.]|uniref:tail protein X n=1 Tax=Cetobacterium sp. TaxID=2071632 RepID=UPI003F2A6090